MLVQATAQTPAAEQEPLQHSAPVRHAAPLAEHAGSPEKSVETVARPLRFMVRLTGATEPSNTEASVGSLTQLGTLLAVTVEQDPAKASA